MADLIRIILSALNVAALAVILATHAVKKIRSNGKPPGVCSYHSGIEAKLDGIADNVRELRRDVRALGERD